MSGDVDKSIELSRVKLFLLLFGSAVFVVLGIWMVFFIYEDEIIAGVGWVSMIFFSLCGFIAMRKLSDKTPGMIISKDGITDNSSGISAGFIPWSDIASIGEYQINHQKFVSIYVANPEDYLKRGNFIQRIFIKANMKMVGTPVNISANSLKIKHADLLRLLEECRSKYIPFK